MPLEPVRPDRPVDDVIDDVAMDGGKAGERGRDDAAAVTGDAVRREGRREAGGGGSGRGELEMEEVVVVVVAAASTPRLGAIDSRPQCSRRPDGSTEGEEEAAAAHAHANDS